MLPITSVVAVTASWGIGKRLTVPWAVEGIKLSEDLKYFRECTTNTVDPNKMNAVIMGRLTWESIPPANRPLKRRINIVISSTLQRNSDDQYHIVPSLDAALQLITKDTNLSNKIEKAVVVGGAKLFEESLFHPWFHTLHLTQVKQDFDCDTFLTDKTINFLKEQDLDKFLIRDNIIEEGVPYKIVEFQPNRA